MLKTQQQLDATLPVEGKDKLTHYKSKFGEARMAQMVPYMEGIGKKEGITFSYGGVIAKYAKSSSTCSPNTHLNIP